MLNQLNFQSFLSDWDWKRRNDWFYWLFSQKSDKLLKIAYFKTFKIGLNKHLFKNKKIRHKGGNIKNGARYYAIIGLIFMMILSF